jgi:hypothetical protein
MHELSAGWVTGRPGLLGPSPPHGPSWAQPKKIKFFKKKFKKKCDFPQFFLLHFDQYRFVFLYFKDTNPILKYPVFVKTLKKIKKMFYFHAYGQVSQK